MGPNRRSWGGAAVALVLLAGCTADDPSAGSTPTTLTAESDTADSHTTVPDTPTVGGTLVVSGESEVANPWTPAKLQCDAYCFVRARTIFDSVAVFGGDQQVHPMIAERITPNDELTEWTIAVRPGIAFHDGTPVDAAAVIANLQATGTGTLLRASLDDIAKRADGSLLIDLVDEMTLTIHTGKGGDPGQPLAWPRLDVLLTGQWGLIASPTWLAAAAADPTLEAHPVGSGPFVFESYSPRQQMVVSRNPGYWRADAEGASSRTSSASSSGSSRTARRPPMRCVPASSMSSPPPTGRPSLGSAATCR